MKSNLLNLSIGQQFQLSHMKSFFVVATDRPNCFSTTFLKAFLKLMLAINFHHCVLPVEFSQCP